MKKTTFLLLGFILAIGIFVLIIAYFLEVPVLGFVYGVDLTPYFVSMMIIIVGSFFYSMSMTLSTILIAMRNTKVQALIYLITAIFTTILSYTLVKKIQIQGASITYLITMLVLTICFIICFLYQIKKKIN